jgi:hypothetical protein
LQRHIIERRNARTLTTKGHIARHILPREMARGVKTAAGPHIGEDGNCAVTTLSTMISLHQLLLGLKWELHRDQVLYTNCIFNQFPIIFQGNYMEYSSIFERELTTMRPTGGRVDAVEVWQREDGQWQINIFVSWKPNIKFTVCLFNLREVKLYAQAATALRHVVAKYDYFGMIALYPREGMLAKNLI